MSLTREALIKWRDYARQDLESAPPDGMLAFLVESVPENEYGSGLWDKRGVEIVAVAYAKALQEYVRP